MALIEEIHKEVQPFFKDASSCHAYDHTERVVALCKHIGKKEKADLEILEIAALLHDICKPEELRTKGAICHAEKGGEIAKQILKKYNIQKERIEAIVHCIKTHRKSKDLKPQTLEGKILSDADKLDQLGAVGVGRTFMCANEIGAKLHNDKEVRKHIEETKPYTQEDTAYREFALMLSKIKDTLYTEEAKRIAKERHEFMVNFFERLNKEIVGEI